MEFPRPIFEKKSNTKFHTKNHSVVAELFQAERQTDKQTDRNNEANIRFSQFYERAYKPQIPKTNAATGANSVWGRIDEIFNDAMILTNKCHFTRLILYVDSFRYQHSAAGFNFSQSHLYQPNVRVTTAISYSYNAYVLV